MSAPRGRRARTPVATKRLVLHRPAAPEDPWGGPRDGDPVWLPAPCGRLRAGYLCECGFGFDFDPYSAGDWDFARVEALADGTAPWYQEEDWVLAGPVHGWATATDQAALVLQTEALPVGTVVERFGIGIAPAFEDRSCQLVAPGPGWDDLPPF